MTKRDKRLFEVAIAVLLVMGMTLLVYELGADTIVAYIGVENTYLITFLVALFGGMTSLGGPTYVATIVTFVSGGATIPLIAIAAGLGIIIGDSIYYLVSKRGRNVLREGTFKKFVTKLERWIEKRDGFTVFLFTFAYMGFTPFPNDVITVTAGMANVPKKIMLPAIVCGATTHAFILAYLGKSLFAM